MSTKNEAPFPLPEKTKSKFSPSSSLSTLLLRRSFSSPKEKTGKTGLDPEYEEIGPQRNHNNLIENQNEQKKEEFPPCDLCGSSEASVRCDKCNSQAFCNACDETFHGHPKRASHIRKALTAEVGPDKPPLPRKLPDGSPVNAPQPPPRKNKKGGILSSTFGLKEQGRAMTPHIITPSGDQYSLVQKSAGENETGKTLMGSLKKIMGNRPLPPPPDQNLDKRRNSTPDAKTTNISRSNPALNNDGSGVPMTVALPQSIMEINSKASIKKTPSSMPPTPPLASNAQYPKLQPRSPNVSNRKLSLQQFPVTSFDEKRASMTDGAQLTNNSFEKSQHPLQQQQQQQQPTTNAQKLRSQSISDENWNKMLMLHGSQGAPGQPFTGNAATSEVGGVSLPRRAYNTMGTSSRPFGRGMVSSASVCDLNTLAQQHQQQPPPQQHQHQHQHQQQQPHGFQSMNSANSFQQLSIMSYDPNMMWVQPQPSHCNLCQPQHVYPQPIGHGGMKRTASNISMNLSSVGSDVSGYPWVPHVHHHMPVGYPGYYPPGCHQHMMPPGFSQESPMPISDGMRNYNRMPSSPAPSVRSTSHRSHKSSKSRSFSANETGRRSRNHSRKRSEESEESASSSVSEENNLPVTPSKTNKPGGLAWQCDHCTFINPGHVSACGMCSKIPGKSNNKNHKKGNDRRRNERRDRKIDSGENVEDISDYENDHRKENRRESRLKSTGSVKSSSGRSKKKSRRKESSPSSSSSDSESDEDEEIQIEKQLKDLRLSSRSRAGDYDRYSVTSRTREKDKERGSLKKEGKHGYRRRVL